MLAEKDFSFLSNWHVKCSLETTKSTILAKKTRRNSFEEKSFFFIFVMEYGKCTSTKCSYVLENFTLRILVGFFIVFAKKKFRFKSLE